MKKFTVSGGNDGEVPPVPIPNTEVKLSSAESTWLDTAREDRSLPESIFLSSSMAEHSAVNRVVVGSSPTWGANYPLLAKAAEEGFLHSKGLVQKTTNEIQQREEKHEHH